MNRTFTVFGNHGELTVDAECGAVLKWVKAEDQCCDHECTAYADIANFDVGEWAGYYGDTPAGMAIDILDISFWTTSGEYVQNERGV